MDDMEKDLLTVHEAAKLKGVTQSAIYLAMAQGRLPCSRVLGRLVVTKRDVLTWRPTPHVGRRKGTPVSESVKARISQSQKRRWAQRKRSG